MEGDFRVGEWLVHPSLNSMSHGDETAQVEPKVMEVLVCLAERPGEVLHKERIIQAVWPDTFVTDDVLTGAISDLRRTFGDDAKSPRFIQTIPKKGYRLIAPVSTEAETIAVRYREVREIGRGGMGEVYLFEDILLRRNVAMKFLAADMEQDEESKKRLQREARAAAALDHPFICKVYDTGEWQSRAFIAMEYVEGQTLKEKLASGRLSVPEALRITSETAEALETAYEKGIVHRDIKPSNIVLTPQGHVKVTDFGLAKRLQPKGGQKQDWTETLTQDATVKGTLPYMSPEQLRAGKVDHRSDIYSLGVVLYEMLTGVNPFRREVEAETTSAILTEEAPELTGKLEGIPPLLQHTVHKMLAKDPERRYQLVHEVRTDLIGLAEQHSEVAMVQPPSVGVTAVHRESSRVPRLVPWAAAILIGLTAAVALWWLSSQQAESPPVVRSVIPLPPGREFGGWAFPPLSFSPDGRLLAFVAEHEGQRQVYLRSLEESESRPIAGTEDAQAPFFSPDSRWIGFLGEDNVQKVPVEGGPPLEICKTEVAVSGPGATWGTDGTIVFTPRFQSPLYRVDSGGGAAPEQITTLNREKGERSHRWPEFLPDGQTVLFFAGSRSPNTGVNLMSLGTGDRHFLLEGYGRPQYTSSGHLIYGHGGNLLAVPFDLERHQVTGSPVPVQNGVFVHSSNAHYFSVSPTGTLAYVHLAGGAARQLVKVDRQGRNVETLIAYRDYYFLVRLSPDARRLAVQILGSEKKGVWVYDLDRGTQVRHVGGGPVWTPDGRHLVLSRELDSGHRELWVVPADGSGGGQVLWRSRGAKPGPIQLHGGSVSPDGRLLAFHEERVVSPGEATESRSGHPNMDIWIKPLEGDGEAWPFLETPSSERAPAFSRDGRWLAYVSDESGQDEVYVKSFPDTEQRWPISVDGGSEPRWSADGSELFYLRDAREFFAVPINTEITFSSAKPRLLFIRANDWLGWDVYPDGQHFLLIQILKETQIEIVLNWTEELKRLVPVE